MKVWISSEIFHNRINYWKKGQRLCWGLHLGVGDGRRVGRSCHQAPVYLTTVDYSIFRLFLSFLFSTGLSELIWHRSIKCLNPRLVMATSPLWVEGPRIWFYASCVVFSTKVLCLREYSHLQTFFFLKTIADLIVYNPLACVTAPPLTQFSC